ncbi:MAG: glutamyl-tRNA amidotransferase, partial [Verrucomicrobiae bacterium]|nr:glutamyl-tRNA amidotransferase [Verrucomicrobiae bacterium]
MNKNLFQPALLALLLLLTRHPVAAFDLETATIAEIQAAMDQDDLTAESLTHFYLDRIEAFDKQGPRINAVITLNDHALQTARALDKERKAKGPRGPLHGIPVVLKDNIDTFDLPTTGGCSLLAGSIPPDDAFIVKRLREAGAIILFKANMAEFASSGGAPEGFSSMGGQTRNPYDPTRGPSGSSGGPGAALAAAFAQTGLGTDTSSSVRAPCSVNGLAGLRPTLGLISRDGIIPLSLSFDTAGPMARHIYDVAVTLDAIAGVDPADEETAKAAQHTPQSYTRFLKPGTLKGARIGVARAYMGQDQGTDRVIEWSLLKLKQLGAEVIDPIEFPRLAVQSRSAVYHIVRHTDFPLQINDYLATLKPGFPKTLRELIAQAENPENGYNSPWKIEDYKEELEMPGYDNPVYRAGHDLGREMVRMSMQAVFDEKKLDAIIYPTQPFPAVKIDAEKRNKEDALTFGAVAGFPEVVVPAGMTNDGLPVTLSFLGTAFRDAELLGYAYDFEQATKAYKLPDSTP